MAYLPSTLSEDEIKKTPVSNIRKEYTKIAGYYNKIADNEIIFCPKCGKPLTSHAFYKDDRYAIGVYPICKDCLLKIVEQRKTDKDEPKETKESIKEVLRMLDRPFINSLYEQSVKAMSIDTGERGNKRSIFQTMYVQLVTLPQQVNLRQKDSDPDDMVTSEDQEVNENSRIVKAGRKRFGDYSPADLKYLETQYEDWTSRYECNSKAQEVLFQRICCKQLEIDKAQKSGKDTSKLDKDLQDLMASTNIKPSQFGTDQFTDAQTFGTLIGLWENTKPISEPSEEFKDVDKIGLYIDVFFKGHLAKMMDLRNAFSDIYDRYIKKYTVKKPEYGEEEDTEALFGKIFGTHVDDEAEV